MLSFFLILFFLSSVAAFEIINFSSVRQCGPFNVTFSGNQPTALPLTLTVVPFGSSALPLSVPLPSPEWDSEASTGAVTTFLPYPAGTTFVASLDDAQDRSTGLTSDIIKVLQSDNVSCIPTAIQSQTYTPELPFSQCEPFNVTFDPTQAILPEVRLFVPNAQALLLNQTQRSTVPGTTSFTMTVLRGQSVILLFRDGSDRLQSTNLSTVIGDVTSGESCFPNLPNHGGLRNSQQTGISRQAAIGIIASVASVVTLLSIFVVVRCFLLPRRSGRIHSATHQEGVEGSSGFTKQGITSPPDAQFTQSESWDPVAIINNSTPHRMEKHPSRPVSHHIIPINSYVLDRYQQMQLLDAATADLDRIIKASVFAPNDDNRAWSPSFLHPASNLRYVRNTRSLIGMRKKPKAAAPTSPLSSMPNSRGPIIPVSYIGGEGSEADAGVGGGRVCDTA